MRKPNLSACPFFVKILSAALKLTATKRSSSTKTQFLPLIPLSSISHSIHPFSSPLLVLKRLLLAGNVSVGNNVAQFGHTLGISGLVVIPGIDLHQGAINDLRTEGIDDGTAGIVGVVGGHEGLLLISQNALERSGFAGSLKGGIDLLLGGGLLHLEDAVGETGVEERNADGQTVQLALEFGVNLDNGRGRAGGGGTQVEHTGTGTAEVGLLGVGHVDQSLGAGNVMDGGNAAVLDTKIFLDDLDDRRQTVGRTTGIGNQLLLLREESMVAPQNDVEGLGFLDGGRDDDALHAAFREVRVERLDLEELAGAFHHHVDAHGGPVDLGEVGLLGEGDGLVVDGEGGVVDLVDLVVPRAMDRIVLDEVRGRFAGADVVDVNDFERGIVPGVAEDETSDAAKAVDGALDGHGGLGGGCSSWLTEVPRMANVFEGRRIQVR
mmetsp:Transcript_32507/g.95811  ORF Transcript_32507/g.95811 Transcript_32507/m.95811 type:complete len:436 (-) Transcript_32507:117-1424(-)